MRIILSLFLIAFLAIPVAAQNDWKINGQIQLRSELDGRDFSNDTHPLTFASLRTRLGIEKTFMEKLNFFVQIQDSRVFGEEANTLASIDNVDLHQAYVNLKNPFDWCWEIQAGRFEVAYGTERFFGAVGWHYVGRSWDGVRFKFSSLNLDAFALTHTESVPYIGNAVPGVYTDMPTPSYSVYGLWEQAKLDERNKLDVFGYYQINRVKNSEDENALDMFTLGASHFGNYGAFSTITEAAYQFGKTNGMDIGAYLFSFQGNYSAGANKFGIGADILSGTDEAGKANTFNPSFGTNHKFYGYMDYFINIPGNTYNLGLNDFYLIYNYAPADCNWEGGVNFHHFMSNKEPGGDLSSAFGQEIDLTIKYKFIPGTALTWGGSVFFPGDIMKTAFSTNVVKEDPGFWSYLMITAAIN